MILSVFLLRALPITQFNNLFLNGLYILTIGYPDKDLPPKSRKTECATNNITPLSLANSLSRESLLEISILEMHYQIPQQDNGIDCGVFTMLYAKYLAAGYSFTFEQEDMGKFRKNIYEDNSKT